MAERKCSSRPVHRNLPWTGKTKRRRCRSLVRTDLWKPAVPGLYCLRAKYWLQDRVESRKKEPVPLPFERTELDTGRGAAGIAGSRRRSVRVALHHHLPHAAAENMRLFPSHSFSCFHAELEPISTVHYVLRRVQCQEPFWMFCYVIAPLSEGNSVSVTSGTQFHHSLTHSLVCTLRVDKRYVI